MESTYRFIHFLVFLALFFFLDLALFERAFPRVPRRALVLRLVDFLDTDFAADLDFPPGKYLKNHSSHSLLLRFPLSFSNIDVLSVRILSNVVCFPKHARENRFNTPFWDNRFCFWTSNMYSAIQSRRLMS